MTTTLTQRYVCATVKNLGPAAENDVRAELEASIADAIEARIEQGEGPVEAERAVLTGLGDPSILAAGYAERPLHLIGPRYYLTWLRLLKLLLVIVPITAVGGVILAQLLAGASFGTIVGQIFSVGIQVTVNVAFWLTLVFVVLERTGADTGVRWDVDQLPEPHDTGAGRSNMIASLIWLGVLAAALLWDRHIGFVRLDGEPLPVLSPGLWPWAVSGFFLLIAAAAVHAVLVHAAGRWTVGLAVLNTALTVAFLSLALTLLGRDQLFNPGFIAAAFTDNGVNADTLRTLAMLTGFTLAGIAIWDIADGWLKAARAGRR